MSAHDAHYAGELVDGARMLALFGDLATELLIRLDGDEGLFRAYDTVEFLAPVFAGDYIEASAELTRVGASSRSMRFEARKVITSARGATAPSAADVLFEPIVVARAIGTCVVPRELQRRPRELYMPGLPAGPAPTVTKLSPKKGPAAGSTTVTVTGTGFAGATSVRFGSANALSYEVDSTTSITALAPAHASGAVEVTVTTPNGQSAPTSRDRYTYEAPTVTSVSPDVGSKEGDAAVTVTGSGFAPGTGTTVFEFGKGVALSVSCASTGECTMRAPAARKAGTVDVRAKAAGKTSKKNPPADQYTYD